MQQISTTYKSVVALLKDALAGLHRGHRNGVGYTLEERCRRVHDKLRVHHRGGGGPREVDAHGVGPVPHDDEVVCICNVQEAAVLPQICRSVVAPLCNAPWYTIAYTPVAHHNARDGPSHEYCVLPDRWVVRAKTTPGKQQNQASVAEWHYGIE